MKPNSEFWELVGLALLFLAIFGGVALMKWAGV